MPRFDPDDPEAMRMREEANPDFGPLFGPPIPTNHIDTSDEAALSLTGVVNALRWQVLQAVVEAPDGATCQELEAQLQLCHQTVSGRLWELAGKSRQVPIAPLVVASPDRRLTTSGRHARVYRPTPAGRSLYSDWAKA